MDPLAQGVFKDDRQVTFIAKTLPGETGTARLIKAKKGVRFAKLGVLEKTAGNRVDPQCVHFGQCPGCHYLHTGYDDEINYKKAVLDQCLKKLHYDKERVKVVKAPKRLGYRNRIQLHYRGKTIGLIDGLSDEIIEIPACKIIRDELRPAIEALYSDRGWSTQHRGSGHCELYLNHGSICVQWDKPYAHGGFSQVFDAMNTALRNTVFEHLQRMEFTSILELFVGDGNLSRMPGHEHKVQCVMVDNSPINNDENFIRLDLFDPSALHAFQAKCKLRHFDVLLLDPPRKGFIALCQWVKKFRPKKLIYVSCNLATLVRDLASLEGKFVIDDLALIDLFPSTYHFETVALVSFKK